MASHPPTPAGTEAGRFESGLRLDEPMLTVESEPELRREIGAWRLVGSRIGFVPTMGALHAGHLALVRRARELVERVVVSIFVNPTQFAPGEDFESYPRTVDRDAELLEAEGCDLLFLPAVSVVYPDGHCTFVDPSGPAEGLEGDHRPGHFRGVATVVTQLFNLVQPDLAVFGEKDAQQLAVIRRLVDDLHLPVEIVGHPTVREEDGLALSSRNTYLSADERRAATVLHRALEEAAGLIDRGERSAASIRTAMRQLIEAEPLTRLDYAEVVDGRTFQPIEFIHGHVVLPLAAHIGTTRLIDNVQLEVSD
jgi:pantoate--beta-alanine ligase